MNRFYLQHFIESYPTTKEFRMNICRYYILNGINIFCSKNKLIGIDFIENIVRKYMRDDPFFNFSFSKLHRLYDKSYLVSIEGGNDFIFFGFRNESLFNSWLHRDIRPNFKIHFNLDTFETDYEQIIYN